MKRKNKIHRRDFRPGFKPVAPVNKAPGAQNEAIQPEMVMKPARLVKTIQTLHHGQIWGFNYVAMSCPTIWYAYLVSGHILYIRYRWGRLIICQSAEPTESKWDAVAGREIMNIKIGGPYDGMIEWDEIIPYLEKL